MQNLYRENQNRFTGIPGRLLLVAVILLAWSTLAFGADDCFFSDLADVPLDTKEQAAPGVIMMVFDTSGSMHWSMLSETGSQFSGDSHESVFHHEDMVNVDEDEKEIPYDAYYLYNTGDQDGWNVLEGDDRLIWPSQCADYNKMYYDPDVEYKPWPRWDELSGTDTVGWSDPLPSTTAHDMDPDDPRSDPTENNYTIDMNSTYTTYGSGGGTTVGATGTVIVDDQDGGQDTSSMKVEMNAEEQGRTCADAVALVEPGTGGIDGGNRVAVVDNGDSGFYKLEDENWEYFDGQPIYNGDGEFWDDDNNNYPSSSVYWEFDLDSTATYEVWVSWKEYDQRPEDVKYTVHHKNGKDSVSVDQTKEPPVVEWASGDKGGWKKLGEFEMGPGSCTPFEKTGGWDNGTSGYGINDNYLYTANTPEDYTATWRTCNLEDDTNYDVYAYWISNNQRGDVDYTISDSSTPLKTVSKDQSINGGSWNLLAEDLSFSSGNGVVELSHSATADSLACADAVAFVPSALDTLDIANAHYYVKNDNGVFLVNLDGEIGYYRVNDENDNYKLEEGELEELNDTEAENAGIVTGRSYHKERVNFANWFSFYRRREFSAKNALGRIIDDIQGVDIGILGFDGSPEIKAKPVDVDMDGNNMDYSNDLLNDLYDIESNDSTHLRSALKNAGEYFEGENMKPSYFNLPYGKSDDSYPFYKADKGGACSQAFAIAMSDGYYNENLSDIGNEDGDNNTDYDGGGLGDDTSGTLADVAMNYYETDLNADLNNVVPVSTRDKAEHQHMVTYTVSFGMDGSINEEQRKGNASCPVGACPDSWPETTEDPAKKFDKAEKIDDMFHAALNGRGKFLNAGDPDALVNAMQEIQSDIESRMGSAAAVDTNTIQLKKGSRVYQGVYNTKSWTGDVRSFNLGLNGSIQQDNPVWEAAGQLDERIDNEGSGDRVIYSYNGSKGMEFKEENNSTIGLSKDLINYLRGDETKNQDNGGKFRVRSSKLGDVVHSAPRYLNGTVYVGANDGMLHAFDADTGAEEFAYVPNRVIEEGNLQNYADPNYSHKFFVDNTVLIQETDSKTLLVGGLRKGGKGYFCLDISGDVENRSAEDVVQWEYPDSESGEDGNLGYSYSRAYVVETEAEGWVVVFGNGYGSDEGSAVLYVLDANNGEVLETIDTNYNSSGCNGLSSPAIIDADSDGYVEYAYAGDLKGNMWKFDLSNSTDSSEWGVAYEDVYSSDDKPLIRVKNNDGGQPITVQPGVTRMDCSADRKGYFVVFGTGRYLTADDFNSTDTQTFYGVWDWQKDWGSNPEGKYLGEFNVDGTDPELRNSLSGGKLTLLEQWSNATEGRGGHTYRIFTDNPINYPTPPSGETGSTYHAGWYYNLPDDRAQIVEDPMLRPAPGNDIGIVTFLSSIPSDSPCDAGGTSWIYQVSLCNGGQPDLSPFDTTGDDEVDEDDKFGDEAGSGKKYDQGLNEPTYIGDEDGGTLFKSYKEGGGGEGDKVLGMKPGPKNWRLITD